LAFHKSQNMQQAINWYKCICDWSPCTSFLMFTYYNRMSCIKIFSSQCQIFHTAYLSWCNCA